ncbi:TM2 domain-containing protein [Arthrobacter sp. UYCo732]|uniref:TM2 domain-containing protein n=1 Tax=Arthrobacter sp. UYCo732 TaxID=3156336 RepID=UPI003399C406
MTLALGPDQPFTDFIVDDLEGDEVAGIVHPEPGLELPYLDVDAPGFSWPSPHPLIGLPPRAALVPADRIHGDEPAPTRELKRNRHTLRAQADSNFPHAVPAPAADVLPSRRSLRQTRAAEPHVVRTVTISQPIVPAAPVEAPALEDPVVVAEPAAPVAPAEPAPDAAGLALAALLEEALDDAFSEESDVEEDVPSVRQQRLTKAVALANDEPVDHLPELPPLSSGTEYASMLASYGAFPPLRPPGRDFKLPLALSVFLGFLGADRFYERKFPSGALKLVTAGGVGVWWIADIISILTGRTKDKDGQPYSGDKNHRIIAGSIIAALFAGLVPVAGLTVAPVATTGVTAVNDALFPKPAPVPAWNVIADVKGSPDPIVLDVTADRLRLTYNFPGAVYAYLQKESSTPVPADTVIIKELPSKGEANVKVSPGRYQLIVRTDGNGWTIKAEEWAVQG